MDSEYERNDFHYFWRNVGRTRKGDTDLGRWGLGKTVFQAASRINSFFGVTVRNDDRRTMLMGQSVLKIHKVNGSRYAPYGSFAIFDKTFPLPIEDADYVASFVGKFSVDRLEKPGFSILVPYPDQDAMAPEMCVKAAIKHYFFPLLAGQLIVQVKHGNGVTTLDALQFDSLLRNKRWLKSQGLLGLVELGRWAIRQPKDAFFHLQEPPAGKAPKLREALFPRDVLEAARDAFAQKRRVAFSVPIAVQKAKSKDIMHTGFSVFLERDEMLNKAEDHFIRQGITIPEVSSLRHKGIRAIVSVAERDLSAFLGDSENPAHTEWERNSRKFKLKYRLGVSTLDFVKSSPREIVKLLTQPKKGRDQNLLKHLFSLPVEPDTEAAGDRHSKKKGPGEDKASNGGFVGIEGSQYLQLTPIRRGFRLMRKSKAMKVPKYVLVWMAYEVRSGNPFKKYSPLDFDISQEPIRLRLNGGNLLLCRQNTIQIEVLRGDFSLTVTGFDPHRDLRVRTVP